MRIGKRARLMAKLAFVLGFGGAALVLISAFVADRALGREVLLIAPHSPETVALNRLLYEEGDPVPEVYGNAMSEPVRMVAPSDERLIRPDEDPDLLLMPVDKTKGENPLQVRTVWFLGSYAMGGGVLLGVLGGVPLLLRRREDETP